MSERKKLSTKNMLRDIVFLQVRGKVLQLSKIVANLCSIFLINHVMGANCKVLEMERI